MNIYYDSGTEGPKHDPYHYEEWTVETTGGVTIIGHFGLMEWVKVDEVIKVRGEGAVKVFEAFVGMSMYKMQKAYDKVHSFKECPQCHSPKYLEWQEGHPGESLLCCTRCKIILTSEVNLSEVE